MVMARVTKSDDETKSRVRWQGEIQAIQCRAWVWRYRTDNRTHYHLGYNLWVDGEIEGDERKFIVAISETQYSKTQYRMGDVAKGTGWPCKKAKHEIGDLYRAGGLKLISRTGGVSTRLPPPFVQSPPPLRVFKARGARMLYQKKWRRECMTCMWANKSAVEIEYNFGKSKRYRTETFCYGPKSCPLYEKGDARPVPYYGESVHSMDDGGLDECLTGHRGYDE